MNNSMVIGMLTFGQQVQIIDVENNYGKLFLRPGWVSMEFLVERNGIFYVNTQFLNIREASGKYSAEVVHRNFSPYKCKYCGVSLIEKYGLCSFCGAPIERV